MKPNSVQEIAKQSDFLQQNHKQRCNDDLQSANFSGDDSLALGEALKAIVREMEFRGKSVIQVADPSVLGKAATRLASMYQTFNKIDSNALMLAVDLIEATCSPGVINERGLDIKGIRRTNLKALIKESEQEAGKKIGGRAEVAKRVGSSPAYISQIVSDNPVREVGDDLARRLEKAYGKPLGWMDERHLALWEHLGLESGNPVDTEAKDLGKEP